jgi:hypothetical protein
MTDFGVQPTGFVLKTQQDILGEIETDQLAEISPAWDVSSDQPVGQMNGIVSRQLAQVWEQLQTVYNSDDPDSAEDDALENLSKLTGTERRAASFTKITVTVDLDAGTVLENGEAFAYPSGKPDDRFTPETSFTAPSDGTHELVFVAENSGPVAAPTGVYVIATPINGWTQLQHPGSPPAIIGREIDNDETLRERREAQLTASGSSTVDAIAADLLELAAIESVRMFENVTNITDANGLPPHSFEAVILDSAADDDEIAQRIWDSKPAGIRSYGSGSESGTAIDENGDSQVVAFTRVTTKNVWLEYDLVTGPGYAGDATVKALAVAGGTEFFKKAGSDVLRVMLEGMPMNVTGVTNVLSLKLGFSASPTQSADLPIDDRTVARFDVSRVTIV